jgi:hypothetical protein
MRTWLLLALAALTSLPLPAQTTAPHPTSGLPFEVEGFPASGLAVIPESALQLTPLANQDRFQIIFRLTNQTGTLVKSFDLGYEVRESDGFVVETGGFTLDEKVRASETRRLRHEILGLKLQEGQRLVLTPWSDSAPVPPTDLCLTYCDRCYDRVTTCTDGVDTIECSCSPNR